LTHYQIKIYEQAAALPEPWDVVAAENIFLTRKYLEVLELSAPMNMECHFIGMFYEEKLCAIALSQFLDLNKLESFGERDKGIKTLARNIIFKHLSSHVLLIGNNMLSGQNAFAFLPTEQKANVLNGLITASSILKKQYERNGTQIHLESFKDFADTDSSEYLNAGFAKFYKFSTQPSMVFTVDDNWNSFADYVSALNKKYRDQCKRAQKKICGIVKVKMDLANIKYHESTINRLYNHVATNAPFNTFFLAQHHFATMKEKLQDKFLFYGYFSDGAMVGFNTLIKNGEVLDTYFLGYDEAVQRERMLYLNMLYDMIGYAIKKQFKKVVFARTALEIKSSVGAQPEEMFGFMQHRNTVVHRNLPKIFKYLEPDVEWHRRHPFKDS
jgi:hypothetical protein